LTKILILYSVPNLRSSYIRTVWSGGEKREGRDGIQSIARPKVHWVRAREKRKSMMVRMILIRCVLIEVLLALEGKEGRKGSNGLTSRGEKKGESIIRY